MSIDKAVLIMIIPRYGKNSRSGFDKALQILIADGSGERLAESMLYSNHFKWHKDFDIQFGYKDDQTSDTLRIEFNPNKCDLRQLAKLFALMRPNQFPFFYFSRLDFAIDYFKTLDPRYFTDSKKSQSHSYTRKGRGVETIYFGSSMSEVQIRVYNKLTERLKFELNPERIEMKQEKLSPDDFDSSWWRVEAQIRCDLHVFNDLEKNPFKSLDIYSQLPHTGDWKLNGFFALAERDGLESAFSEMPVQTRSRYRKKIESYKDRFLYHPKMIFDDFGNMCFRNLCDYLEQVFNEGQFLFKSTGLESLYVD